MKIDFGIGHGVWNDSLKPDFSKYPMNSVEFSAVLRRMMKVTPCKSEQELERFLHLTYGEIEEAKARNMIPAYFLLMLMKRIYASPRWVLTGEGYPFLTDMCLETESKQNILEYIIEEIDIILQLAEENDRIRKRVLYLYGKESRFLV